MFVGFVAVFDGAVGVVVVLYVGAVAIVVYCGRFRVVCCFIVGVCAGRFVV